MSGIELKFTGLSEDEAIALATAAKMIKAGDMVPPAYGTVMSFRHTEIPAAEDMQGETVQPVDNSAHTGADATVYDAMGLPWDGKIHSSTKRLNENGSWAIRRGGKGPAADAYAREFNLRKGGASTSQLAPAVAEPTSPWPISQPPAPPAPPVPNFPAPQIDYATWYATWETLFKMNKVPNDFWGEMNQRSGVTDAGQYEHNATARQISFGIMKQVELA